MDSLIPADGYVISVHGTAKDALAGVKVGDKVSLEENLGSPWDKAVWIQGAGPRLVANGNVDVTANEEQFPSDIASGRAPRTAAGVTKDGDYILAVVDGRQDSSIGCTLMELATLMKQFGAKDAMNFDGGGSSEMVIGGQVVNSPSDGSERRIGCALILVNK
jgi:exopolysaccharide biosynthesis protein